jgi:hypothetical protein
MRFPPTFPPSFSSRCFLHKLEQNIGGKSIFPPDFDKTRICSIFLAGDVALPVDSKLDPTEIVVGLA